MIRIWLIILIFLSFSCVKSPIGQQTSSGRAKAPGSSNGGGPAPGTFASTVSSVSVVNNQIVLNGNNLTSVDSVQITGPSGFNETLDIESQSPAELVANGLRSFSFAVDGIFSLVISNAHGAATFQVSFALQDGTVTGSMLSDMGASVGQVLTFDGTDWVPNDLTGLTYAGNWNSTLNSPDLSGGGSAGEYYIVSIAGAYDLAGGSGTDAWGSGDWVVWNSVLNQWEKIDNASGVVTFNGRSGAVVPATNDYTWAQIDKTVSSLSDIADVDTTGAINGKILKFDGTTWVIGDDNSGGGALPQADGSTDGFISSTDWNTFNNKASIATGLSSQYVKGDHSLGTFAFDVRGTTLSGFSSTTGSINSTDTVLSAFNKLDGNVSAKENSITAGTAAQYFRGDKSWQTLNTDNVTEGTNKYYSITQARTDLLETASLTDGLITQSPSSNVVFDELALKQDLITTADDLDVNSITTNTQASVSITPYGTSAGNTGEFRFYELTGNGSNYAGFKAPDILGSSLIWTLPSNDGSTGQILSTNGSGILSWVTDTGGGGSSASTFDVTPIGTGAGQTGEMRYLELAGNGVNYVTFKAPDNLAADLAFVLPSIDGTGGNVLTTNGTGTLSWSAPAGGAALPPGTSSANGYLVAADWTTFNNKQDAISTGSTAQYLKGDLSLGTLATDVRATTLTGFSSGTGVVSSSDTVLMAINKLDGNINNKEASITAGTGTQYYRGDKTWQTLDTDTVAEGTRFYFTDARAQSAVIETSSITNGLTTKSPSSDIVFDELALKQNLITTADDLSVNSLQTDSQAAVVVAPYGTSAGDTGEFRFYELAGNGSNYAGFKAPDSLGTSLIWTLPSNDGSTGQILSTNGSGILSWVTDTGGGGSSASTFDVTPIGTGAGQTGEMRYLELAGNGVNYVTFKAPDNLAADLAFVLPSTDGTSGNVLTTNGVGTLSWSAPAGGSALPPATSGQNGYLVAADWTTFNDKQDSITTGSTAQYLKGDLSLGTLATDVRATDLTGFSSGTGVVSGSDTVLTAINKLDGNINNKEASITAGTGAQYFRGDKNWATLNTTVVAEGTNLYFTDARSQSAVIETSSLTDGLTTKSPSSNVVFDELALKQGLITTADDLDVNSITTNSQASVMISPYGTTAGDTGEFRFYELTGNGSNYAGFKAPDALGSSLIWTLPSNDGSTGQILSTNGSGILSWVTDTGGGGSSASTFDVTPIGTGAGQTGEMRYLELAGNGVNYVTFKAPDNLAADLAFVLPSIDGTSGNVLTTNGTGTLSWSAPAGGAALPPGTSSANGYLVAADWTTFNNKQDPITTGSTAQYLKGDLSLGTLATDVRATTLTGFSSGTGVVSGTDTVLTAINKLDGNINNKEASITSGTGTQYFRGDKNWATLNTTVVAEGTNLYFTDARSQSAVIETSSLTDGLTTKSPSSNVVFDQLALKQTVLTNADDLSLNSVTTDSQAALNLMSFGSSAGQTGEFRFYDLNDSNYVAFKSPDTVGSNITWTLPSNDGGSGQILSTNGSGVLSWVTDSGGGGSSASTFDVTPIGTGAGQTGEMRYLELAGNGVNYVTFKAPDNLAADLAFVLPSIDGTSGNVLTTNGTGTLSWSAPAGGAALPPGTSSANGYLVAADWTTFNDKQDSITTGSTAQYLKGDLSLGTLATDVRATALTGFSSGSGVVSGTDTVVTAINKLDGNIGLKEDTLAAGTGTQYYRGDKNWATLNTLVVTEATNLYFTNTRAQTAVIEEASLTDGLTTKSPSSNVVFDQLATKLDTLASASDLRFHDLDDTNYVGFRSPNTVASNLIWTLPAADGSNGEVLTTNGSGVLSWAAGGGGGGTSATVYDINEISAAVTGEIRFNELTANPGGNYTSFKSPNSLSTNLVLVLPPNAGTTGQVLTTNGSGILSWGTPAGGSALPQANGTTDGFLEMNDWTTFSGKQDAITAGTTAQYLKGDFSLGTFQNDVRTTDLTGFVSGAGAVSTADTFLSAINKLNGNIATKEASLVTGTALQYFRGNKTLATLNTDAVPEGANKYYSITTARTDLIESISITDGLLTKSPSSDVVFDQLATKLDTLTAASDLRFYDLDNSNYTGFRSPSALGGNTIWTLPLADGANGQMLTTDGSGVLTWETAGAGGGTTSADTFTVTEADATTVGEIRFDELSSSPGSNFVALRSPDSVQTTVTWTLPDADGANGEVLSTDGSGALSWVAGGGGGGGGGTAIALDNHTSNYTVLAADDAKVLIVTGSSTITLPAASTAGNGFTVTIKNNDASNIIKVKGDGSETIDGANIVSLFDKYSSVEVASDGTEWFVTYSKGSISPLLCPNGYVSVPGNATLGTDEFCVMKYEARNNVVTGLPSSISKGTPYANISAFDAFDDCSSLEESGFKGSFHLITNPEWMTVARNLEGVATNWSTGSVGTGFLSRGWSADTGDDGFLNTGVASSSTSSCLYNTGANICSSTGVHKLKRTLTLSTGEIVWDFSGNIDEWVDWDDTAGFTRGPDDTTAGAGDTAREITDLHASLSPSDVQSSSTYNATNGMGRWYGLTDIGNIGASVRGGGFSTGASTGIYTLVLASDETASVEVGFRCVYRP